MTTLDAPTRKTPKLDKLLSTSSIFERSDQNDAVCMTALEIEKLRNDHHAAPGSTDSSEPNSNIS
jgi:hypothetical protein